MPVLLFVMRDGCQAALNANGLADIGLSEYLLEVFKNGIVTLPVEAQKVTYITGLNIDLPRLAEPTVEPAPEPTAKPVRRESHDEEDEEETAVIWAGPTVKPAETPDYVSLYASQTARDVVEAEELAHVIDILVNNVQPQAVNLLKNKFPPMPSRKPPPSQPRRSVRSDWRASIGRLWKRRKWSSGCWIPSIPPTSSPWWRR